MNGDRCAFPRPPATVWVHRDGERAQETHAGHEGMSVREWYAGQALPGVIAARSAAGLDLGQESIAEEFGVAVEDVFPKGVAA